MKSMFQTIMYRMFRAGRGDMSLYQEALKVQAFNKESNSLLGYVIKKVLSAPNDSPLIEKPWTAINKMLTKEEYTEALSQGCKLWKHVLDIHANLAVERVSTQLSDHFKNANDFLIARLNALGETKLAASLSQV